MNENRSGQIHPVDEMLPTGQLFAYGLQHVLAMYAGAVAVPIIVAQALHLSPMELVHLINADLFSCGIATLIQTLGFWKVGAKIPMIHGVTFASVTPMILIGAEHGITAIYGAIIIAGLFTFLIAPFFSRFIRFFPPVVTGTIITIIGITLLPVAVNWMGGGNPKAPDFASPMNLFLAFSYYHRHLSRRQRLFEQCLGLVRPHWRHDHRHGFRADRFFGSGKRFLVRPGYALFLWPSDL